MCAVAVLDERDYAGDIMKPMTVSQHATRAEINNVDWRDDLRQLARLVDLLSPDRDDPEAFYLKNNMVACELRRLAKWRRIGDFKQNAKQLSR